MDQCSAALYDRPRCLATLRQELHDQVDRLADFCESFDGRFFAFEIKVKEALWALGRVAIALFLLARHQRVQEQKQDYPGYRLFPTLLCRTLRTMFGEVPYSRAYWVRRCGGGGFHPLDA